MLAAVLIAQAAAAAASPPTGPLVPMAASIWTNEEEVYFDGEAKRASAPWIGLRIAPGGGVTYVDRFGKVVPAVGEKSLAYGPDGTRLRMTLADGRVTELRRARTATCWGAAPKAVKKPDGGDDWYGAQPLKLHDQGGRVTFGGGTTGAPEVILRMRNVIWPSGPSRPSLVLYVHKPGSPDRAEAYSWADPGAKRVGINLRWMQASCTIDGLE
jgi:hypothetical protein